MSAGGECILGWCIARGYRAGPNPAESKGNLEHLLAGGGGAKVHMPAVPWAEIPEFMDRLRQRGGDAARALEFVALTACRTGEVLGARWAEFDLDARIWTIPPDRMKANREHRIPLAQRVVEILEALPRNGELVFGLPGPSSLLWQMRRLEPKGTVHGLRSSFRDWAAERTNYPREIAEACLAHVVPNAVERSYLRGSFWEKRVRLMAEWAKLCTSPPVEGEVVTLRRSAVDA